MNQKSRNIVSYTAHTKNISQSVSRYIRMTSELYRAALNYIINVCVAHWDDIRSLTGMEAQTYVERLIHGTKHRTPLYSSFDRLYPNFPSYLRRDAITRAIGHVSSYVSNSEKYENIQKARMKKGMRPIRRRHPRFCAGPFIAPSFYKGNMYIPGEDGRLQLKLWNGKDWHYYDISVRSADVHYIARKQADGWKAASPSIKRAFGHWVIAYVFEKKKVKLSDGVRIIVGVDLGIGNDAVCSAMTADGTVVARRFIRLASEKDRLHHLLNRKRGIRSESGQTASLKHISTKILGIGNDVENQTAHMITAFAEEVHADTVVFEHLDPNFRGRSSEKISYWRKMGIFHKACGMLHRIGIRYATVSPKYTSRLAYDGSGRVKRGREISENTPYDVCRFKSGKMYNCDLNASYNIGARYLMRNLKSMSTKSEWSHITAKVPDAAKRTRITLAAYRQAFACVAGAE